MFFLLLNVLGFNVLLAQPCGGSLQFNNSSDEVLLPLNNQMHSSNGFTWECWFKLNTAFGSKARSLIMNEDPVVYEDIFLGFGWNLGMGNFPINRLGFKVDGPNSTTGPSNVACDYAPPGGFLLGTWYHAAGVMNYNTHIAKLYLNGILVDTKIMNSDPITRNVQGHLSYSPNLALGGNEDEIRIWKRVRTDSEILSDYNHCLAGNETDLLSYYRCNQSSGTILLDGTSNGNNGTLVNSTIWSVQQPTLTGSACPGSGSFSVNITTTCNGANATAVSSVSTTMTSPVLSYSWTDSNGIMIGQTTNTSALTNSLTNLVGGIYTLSVQVNAPCGPIISQTISVNCQPPPLCSGTLGAPVFLEDFGSGTSLYGPALPPGVTNYIYQQGVPNNGTYVIAGSSNPSGTNAGYVNDNNDHTGNTNGYMMVVNSDYPAAEVYRKHLTGLCPGTTYVFSAYLANNNSPSAVSSVCGSSYIYANIKFQTEFPLGTVQGSVTSGNLQVAPTATSLPWLQYGFTFTTGSGQTSVDIVLINNAPGGCGNDYVVDDISLSPCGPGVALSIVPNQTVFCSGEALTLQSAYTSGSYVSPQYQWQYSSNGGVTWSNISGATSPNYSISSVISSQAGMYQLLISENGNINSPSCRIAAGPLTFSVSNGVAVAPTSTICPGVTTTLTATGAASYSWSNGVVSNSISVNPSVTTDYTVTGVVGTCTSQAISTLSVVTTSTISVTGNTLLCSGQASTLIANGSAMYVWTPAATLSSSSGSVVVASPTITTTYSAAGTSTLCSSPAVITISVSAAPALALSSNTTICPGANSSATLTVSGATSYAWANSSSLSSSTGSVVVASPNVTTDYTVTGSINSCSSTAVVTVSVNTSPTITSSSVINTTCGLINGSATISSSSANTFSWSTGVSSTTNTANTLAPGNYTVTATNGVCQTSTVIAILGSMPLSITSSTIAPSNCAGNTGSIQVNDNLSASSYSWNPNVSTTNSASNLTPGNYSLAITNGACNTSTVFAVGLVGGPTGINLTIKNVLCRSDSGKVQITSVINGASPYQYNFNNSGFSSLTTFSNLASGGYTLTVKDAGGCSYTQTLFVGRTITHSTIDLITNTPNCESDDGEFILNNIKGGTAPYLTSFNNTPYTSDMSFEMLSSGNYTLNIIDSNNCETGFILVMPENNKDFTLYIPNAFTPNDDIVNDKWYAQGTCLGAFSCLIYNRWGEKIIELNDIKDGWNGTFRGAPVPDGLYAYLIEVQTKNGTINKAGHITLFR